ncbi:MAG: D-alanyl-D-alanine carboxypeptidase, partial [Lachnospiraceae bacterium oral taxon 082]|nr:D-alanyl-D-alanine carboxypeptidase [Lachnospiraceae bacterium oral taxon 082]
AGSIEAFAKMMNDKAASLGCKDSHFANPSGLNNPEHYTSAYDYALISRAAFKNPTVTEIDSATYYNLPPTSRVPTGQTLYSHHSMLRKNSGNYYQNAICGKTGYTTLAGNTLVTYARTDKIGLITVVLNGNKTHYVDTQSLLDFGFANFKNVKLKSSDIGTNFKSNLALIPNFNEYTIEPDDNASITLPNDADVSEVESAMDFEQSESPTANSLCKIDYKYNGRPVGSVDIIAKKNASYEANTNNNTGEITSTAAGNSNHTNTANTGTQGFSNVMLSISKKNMIIGGGIAGIILLLIIIISIRVHLAKKKSDLSDRELRIYGLLKNGWSATDCGISEDEAKYIIEKH